MINLRKSGIDYPVKSELSEINMTEFDKLSKIYDNNKLGNVNKRLEIIRVLGCPDEVVNEIGAKALLEVTQHTLFKIESMELPSSIEIEGNNYTAYEGKEFDLTGGQLAKIEDIYREDKDIAAPIMAVIFKGKDDYSDRVELFKEKLTADIALPYINWINLNIVDTVTAFANES